MAGVVKSAKMSRTIIVRRNYAHYIKKYARYRALGSSERVAAYRALMPHFQGNAGAR